MDPGHWFHSKSLELVSHHPLYHFTEKRKIGEGAIIANVVCRQTCFFLMGLMSVSFSVAHSDVIGLAALISQAGQESRDEVVT